MRIIFQNYPKLGEKKLYDREKYFFYFRNYQDLTNYYIALLDLEMANTMKVCLNIMLLRIRNDMRILI